MMPRKSAMAIASGIVLNACAYGSIVEFEDKDAWFNAVGDVTTITFVEYPHGTFITDQYADQGMIITSQAFILEPGPFPNDGHGLTNCDPVVDDLWIQFTSPMHWLAADYPGAIMFDLYYQSEFITSTSFFVPGGIGNFAGFISDLPFDEVRLHRSVISPSVSVDDLHFGAIPAPGVLGLLAVAGLVVPVGRRRGERAFGRKVCHA